MKTNHPQEPLSYVDAIHHVERWLNENHAEAGYTWRIWDYHGRDETRLSDRPWVGVRVAEVSMSDGRSGAAYMQSDLPWGLAVCAQVERCILALIEGWNQGATVVTDSGEPFVIGDGTDEEFWLLDDLLKKEK